MTWQAGQSGNPAGKPPGATSRAVLRESIAKGLPKVVERLQALAEDGDTMAAKLLLDRGMPACKPTTEEINLPELAAAKTVTAQTDVIVKAIARGLLAPDTGSVLLAGISAAARVMELDELAKRIASLECEGLA